MSDILPEQSQLFEKVVRLENQDVPHLALTHHYRILFLLADDLLFSYFAIDKFHWTILIHCDILRRGCIILLQILHVVGNSVAYEYSSKAFHMEYENSLL